MASNFTGPGKVTIELTPPQKTGIPLWRVLLRFIVVGIIILAIIHGLNWLAYFLG